MNGGKKYRKRWEEKEGRREGKKRDRELGECIADDDFLVDVIGCFMAKFEPLLEMGIQTHYTDAIDHEFIGRHLLFSHADDALVKNNMPKMVKRAGAKGDSFMANLQSVASNFKENVISSEILPSIKQLSLNDLGWKAARHLAKNLLGMKDTAVITKRVLSGLVDEFGDKLGNMEELLKKKGTPEGTRYARDICDIIGEGPLCDLSKIGDCLEGYPEEAFEDGIEWVSCLFVCEWVFIGEPCHIRLFFVILSDLPPLATCMADAFNQSESCRNIAWMKNLIIRIFVDIVKLDNCYFEVDDVGGVSNDTPISVEEGGEPRMMEFRTYLPPEVMCFEPDLLNAPIVLVIDVILAVFNISGPCEVQIQMSMSNYMYDILPYINLPVLGFEIGRPKCRDDSMIHQAAIGWSEHASEHSCIIQITEENWNTTFSVPVSATVDGKSDKDIPLNFTLKMVANGETRNSTKVPMKIVNKDSSRTATCQSVNDPHLLTFDGHLYNNFYHGYFYLYKHEKFPYEVQAIYQACTDNVTESCNCAVAVRSGDDVFVVDRCRRSSCASEDCQLMKATMYTNGQITPGTRVFAKNGGLRYDVILPHGTMIRIVASNDMLNAWVTPSVFDRDSTSGLCGTFNDNVNDDLMFPNGTIYTGDGSGTQEQPREFNKAWRVPPEERIFNGALADSEEYQPLKYCKCHHMILQGVQCTCGERELVEYCDIDTDGEFTVDNMPSIVRRSKLQVASLNENVHVLNEDEIDMDEDYEPQDVEWRPNGEWDETTAQAFCDDFIQNSENALIKKCITELGRAAAFQGQAIVNCVEDIKITDTTNWAISALEAAKYYCVDSMDKKVTLKASDYEEFENGTCLSDCNGVGKCEFGKCTCEPNYIGPDCGLPINEPVLLMDESAICDSRYENCSFATLHGLYFVDSEALKCHVIEGKLSNRDEEVSTFYINENQVACKLPESGSYRVSLMYNKREVPLLTYNSDFIFMAYDSACYTCDIDKQKCELKEGDDYCFIKNGCYATGQIHEDDECSICNTTLSTSKWSDVPSLECMEIRTEERAKEDSDHNELILKSCISASLSAIIIIIVVIAFVMNRKSQKSKHKLKQSESVTPDEFGTDFEHSKPGNDYTTTSFGASIEEAVEEPKRVNGSVPEPTLNGGLDNEVFEAAESNPPTRVSVECAEVSRIKAEAIGRRQRTTSQSSVQSNISVSSFFRVQNIASPDRVRTMSGSSVHGGAGPVHLSGHLDAVVDEDSVVHGIGGYMGGVLTPTGKRKDYEHVTIARL
ncbi:hypothetical protein CAPTEDRAFT_211586 [Capitella teleta]|uniref:VWFD domain-containing protein n=1 Tax=Capitella teleta TaxID=283909 RepID=R7TNC2_CAPTE|nr:hypothetical protein CAPTEDRAFT_211586 [Capitella teleta]|eukprot:ELT95338.1 hypothetical protein CAPTEDRAFT_211586 [Capitella teleta]